MEADIFWEPACLAVGMLILVGGSFFQLYFVQRAARITTGKEKEARFLDPCPAENPPSQSRDGLGAARPGKSRRLVGPLRF